MSLDIVDDLLVAGWLRGFLARAKYAFFRTIAEVLIEAGPLGRKLGELAGRHIIDALMLGVFACACVVLAPIHAAIGTWDWQRGLYPRWPAPYLTNGMFVNASWLMMLALPYLLATAAREGRRLRLKVIRRYLAIPLAIGTLAAPALVRPEGLYACLGLLAAWVVLLGLYVCWWGVPLLAIAGVGALAVGCRLGVLVWNYTLGFAISVVVSGVAAIVTLLVFVAAYKAGAVTNPSAGIDLLEGFGDGGKG